MLIKLHSATLCQNYPWGVPRGWLEWLLKLQLYLCIVWADLMLHKFKKKTVTILGLYDCYHKRRIRKFIILFGVFSRIGKKYNFSVNPEVENFDRKYFFNAIIPFFSIFMIYIHLFKNSEILNRIEFPQTSKVSHSQNLSIKRWKSKKQ